jgi:hypothetical protein
MATYAQQKIQRNRGYDCMPPKRKCTKERRAKLEMLLRLITVELTGTTTLHTLAEHLNLGKDRISHWLHWGEVSIWPAAEITKQYEAKRQKLIKEGEDPPKAITLQDLVPFAFPPR